MDDLFAKYSKFEPSIVKQIYDFNQKDVVRTDFDLKEMSLEPTTSSLSKNSSTNQKVDAEISDDEPKQSPQLTKKSVSQQSPGKRSEEQSPLSETEIGAMVADFREHHKEEVISKHELDAIVDVVREGVRGIDYNEEKFLKAQFSSDLLRLQAFIEAKMKEIIQASYVEGGVNIHNKEEFPTLDDSFDRKKKKNKPGKKNTSSKAAEPEVNLLDKLVADKKAKENENKTDELVNVKLHDPSKNLIIAESDQPLSKWLDYEDNLFVMGNVIVGH